MKTSILGLLLIMSTSLFAQSDITNDVIGHIKTGNSKELVKHFAENVDVAIEPSNVDEIYSRVQAEQILKKFFDEYKPSNCTVKHSGTSQLGIEYRIGELTTAKGNFRISFNLKKVGDAYQIVQFHIENQ